jgi:hypothetical protein
MMAAAANDQGDDWRRVAAALLHPHQQLLMQAESVRKALDPPHFIGTVENSDVNSYLASVGGTALAEAERRELLARLEDDIMALQRLTARIEPLRAMLTDLPDREAPAAQ